MGCGHVLAADHGALTDRHDLTRSTRLVRDEPTLIVSSGVGGERAYLAVFQRLGARGARMLIRAVGEIDVTTAPALAESLDLAWCAARTIPEIIEIEVDLRAVAFLSAAGLTELVRAHRRCERDAVPLRVVADQVVVTRPLRLTGLDQTLGLRAVPDTRAPARVPSPLPAPGGAWGREEPTRADHTS